MYRLFEAMAPVCCVYDVDLRSVAGEYELSVGKELIEEVDFVAAYVSYNVRRLCNDTNSDYDLLGLLDIMRRTKILVDVMTRGAHGHVFCTSFRFDFGYKALDAQDTEKVEQ